MSSVVSYESKRTTYAEKSIHFVDPASDTEVDGLVTEINHQTTQNTSIDGVLDLHGLALP